MPVFYRLHQDQGVAVQELPENKVIKEDEEPEP